MSKVSSNGKASAMLGVGLLLGVAMKNIPIGLCLGVAMGATSKARDKKREKNEENIENEEK